RRCSGRDRPPLGPVVLQLRLCARRRVRGERGDRQCWVMWLQNFNYTPKQTLRLIETFHRTVEPHHVNAYPPSGLRLLPIAGKKPQARSRLRPAGKRFVAGDRTRGGVRPSQQPASGPIIVKPRIGSSLAETSIS